MSRARDLSRLSNQTNFTPDVATGRIGVGSTTPTAKLNVAGIVSATAFYGDGSNLDGVTSSGLGTALNADDENLPETTPLQYIFKAARTLHIGAATSVRVASDTTSGNIAFMREADTIIAVGSTFTIGAGTH